MTNKLSVGKEVLSYCNSCKASLAHLIVVMKDSTTPGKVTCKTCQKTHAFKDASKVNTTKTRAKRAVSRSKKKNEKTWEQLVKNFDGTIKTYSPKECFAQGEVIDHQSFGRGFIEKTIDGTKIYVVFEGDNKTLIHNLG